MGNFDHYAFGNFELFSSFSSSVQTVLELIIHWSYIRGGGPLNNVLSGGATSTHSPSHPIQQGPRAGFHLEVFAA